MNELDFYEAARIAWRRHRADHKARIEASQREVARADFELDAIDNRIAELRLAAAAALTETGAMA